MPTVTMTWSTVLRRLVLFVLAFAATSAVTIAPLATTLSDWAEANPLPAQLYANVAGLIATLAATWIMTRFADHRDFMSIGFTPTNAGRDLSAGLLLGTLWLAVSLGGLLAFGWATRETMTGISYPLLAAAGISVLFNVITQQLLVCGYILQTVRARAGFPVALVVAALLFTVLHAGAFQGGWLPAVNVFGAGVLFCLAYGVSGNLWLGIATHFAWNFLLGPVSGLTVSGSEELGLNWTMFTVAGPDLFTGGAFGVEGGLVVTLITWLIVIALAWFGIGRRHSQ